MASVKVNPPPQLRLPQQFLKDKEIRKFFEQQNLILFQLWNRTGGPSDLVDESVSGTSTGNATTSAFNAKLARLEKRFNSIEAQDFDGLNAKIARLNRKMDILLETLVTEIRALSATELQKQLLNTQKDIHGELRLLNVRFEEMAETTITENDLEN